MEISAKQLGQTRVLDTEGNLICYLHKAILDPDNGQILAFIIKRNSFNRSKAKLLSPYDIMTWKKNILVLNARYEFHQPNDLIRVNQLLQSKRAHLLGKKVYTENGQQLGRVTDYNLNQNLKILSSITAQKNVSHIFYYDKRLIHQKNILEITSQKIIVKDSTLKIPAINLSRNAPDKFALQNSPTLDQALSVRVA